MGGDHRGQAHDEAERQIDAGGNDHEGLAERQQQRRRGEDRDRLQIVDVENKARAIGHSRPGLEEDARKIRNSHARNSAMRTRIDLPSVSVVAAAMKDLPR